MELNRQGKLIKSIAEGESLNSTPVKKKMGMFLNTEVLTLKKMHTMRVVS